MVDINSILGNIKETGKNIQKWFENITNFMTALDYIKSAKNIAVIWHDNIDWDSLWSVLAVKRWIENKFPDKDVKAFTNKKPSSVFDFLNPEINFWEDIKLSEDFDLFVILDSANLERLGGLYENNKDVLKKEKIINIDHHISNTKFWAINIVDSSSPATAQIVYSILSLFENKLAKIVSKAGFDEYIATALLVWIMTDTNNFTTTLTWAKTLKIAWELIEKWADKKSIVENIFQSKTLNQLKLQWLVLDRIKKLEKNGKIVYYSYYSIEDLENLWIDPEDSWVGKELVANLLQIKDASFVSLWKIKDDSTSVSFRSKEIDVNEIAAKLGWGWHKNAAWAKIEWKLSPEEIEEKLLSLIDDSWKLWGKSDE